MKRLNVFIMLFLVVFSLFYFSVENNFVESSVKTEKIICNATIDDFFSKDRVLVVLNDLATDKLEDYEKTDFGIPNCVDVKKLTNDYSAIQSLRGNY